MAAYLRFYQFASSPFDGSVTKRGMVLGTQALKGALAQVKQGLEEGAPRICLNGSEGLGKTSFGRALPKLLAGEAQVAVSIDPGRSWEEIRARACKKFGVEGSAMSRKSLIAAREPGKRLVIVFDQAERLSHETLDHLDILLQYKDEEGQQLVHCVMLANLESAASGAEIPLLWWLDKFTTLQLQFSPIPVEGIRHYVEKHLAKAGWAGGELFTPDALRAIHANTGGVPGAINALCERILIEGGIRGITSINEDFIDELCGNDLDLPPARPAARPETSAESSDSKSLDLTGDLSIGDFGSAGPSAQEMLDDPNAQASLEDEPEVTLRPDPAPVVREDIANLLVTEDSPDHLHTASEAQTESQEKGASLELEDEPHADKFADFYEAERSPSQLVGISRPGSTIAPIQKPPRRTGGMVIGAVLLAAIGWFAWSQLSVPTELIESAEVKIEKVLEKTPKLAIVKPKLADEEAVADIDSTGDVEETEASEEAAVETAILPPSLIDRADELVADPNADLVPIPDVELEDATAVEAEEAVAESETPAEPTEEVASTPAAPVTPKESAAEVESPTPAAPSNTAATAKPKTQPKPATTDIPDEMLVINEYTAIPEAASSAPKLPLPDTEVDDVEEAQTAQSTSEPSAPPARLDEATKTEASKAQPTAPPAPAATPGPGA